MYLPWHPACRQYCLADKERKTKMFEVVLSQAPNICLTGGGEGVKSKERGVIKLKRRYSFYGDWVPLMMGGPQLTKQSEACKHAVHMQQTDPPHRSPQYLPLVCGKFEVISQKPLDCAWEFSPPI